MPKLAPPINSKRPGFARIRARSPSAPAVRARTGPASVPWNRTRIRAVSRQDAKRGSHPVRPDPDRSNPPTEGNAMYSIFYIIGVIVVILAVLQLIA